MKTRRDGFFAMPLSQDDERASSARCYLTGAVRRRSNLAIMPRTLVTALRSMATGRGRHGRARRRDRATSARRGDPERWRDPLARDAAALRHRPGRRPAAPRDCADADRPGVGRNSQNHMYLHFALTLPPGSGWARSCAASRSPDCGTHPDWPAARAHDLLLFTIGRVSPHPYGPDLAMVGAALYSPFSRGNVTLASPTSRCRRVSSFACWRIRATRRACSRQRGLPKEFCSTPWWRAPISEAFLLPSMMSLHQFNRPGGPARCSRSPPRRC